MKIFFIDLLVDLMVFYVLGITEQARKHTAKKQNQKGIVCNDFDPPPVIRQLSNV